MTNTTLSKCAHVVKFARAVAASNPDQALSALIQDLERVMQGTEYLAGSSFGTTFNPAVNVLRNSCKEHAKLVLQRIMNYHLS